MTAAGVECGRVGGGGGGGAAGGVSPADILLPSFIVNVVTTALGILLVCLLYKKDADKRASKSGELNVSTPLKGRRA